MNEDLIHTPLPSFPFLCLSVAPSPRGRSVSISPSKSTTAAKRPSKPDIPDKPDPSDRQNRHNGQNRPDRPDRPHSFNIGSSASGGGSGESETEPPCVMVIGQYGANSSIHGLPKTSSISSRTSKGFQLEALDCFLTDFLIAERDFRTSVSSGWHRRVVWVVQKEKIRRREGAC